MEILNKFKKNLQNYIILLLLVVILFVTYLPINSMFNENDFGKAFKNQDLIGNKVNMVSKSLSITPTQNKGFGLESKKRFISKNVNIQIESNNYFEDLNNLELQIQRFDGLLIYKNQRVDDNNNHHLNFNVRVETDLLEGFLKNLKKIGKINHLNINSNDRTVQVVNYGERISRYEAQKIKYKDILKKENLSIDEEIQIQTRIDSIEDTIFNLNSNLKNINDTVRYSTVSINLDEKVGILDDANFTSVSDISKSFLMAINNMFVLVVEIIGFLIPLLILFFMYKTGRRIVNK